MRKIIVLIAMISIIGCKNEEKVKDSEALTEEKVVDTPNASIETYKEQSMAELKAKLVGEGYQVFDYVDEKTKDTTLMQQYFIAFLKRGPIRNQNEEEANRLQSEHMAHLGKMYDLGYADISGPFGNDGDIRGITIYNVPTLKMADSLANADPMVKAGRLVIEVHPWWAAKGFSLR
jgi:uncharacterized protein